MHATASNPAKFASERDDRVWPKFRGIGSLQQSRHFGEKSRKKLLFHVNRPVPRRLAARRFGRADSFAQLGLPH